MHITVSHIGDLKNTTKFIKASRKIIKMKQIDRFVELCIERLKEETPKKTGLTSESWTYSIERSQNNVTVNIENTNIQNGINIAILIDIGHMTKDGQYISGLHYIDPIIMDTFNEIINDTWKELKKA